MTTTSRRILWYIILALFSYGIAVGLGGAGVGVAAALFVAGGMILEGFLLIEAIRVTRRNGGIFAIQPVRDEKE